MSKRGFAIPNKPDNVTINTTTIRQSKMTREKEKKKQTTIVKTKKKNKTTKQKVIAHTHRGQIEARKWYRCLQTDRERECVCEKGDAAVDPDFGSPQKTPTQKREKKQIERNVRWI